MPSPTDPRLKDYRRVPLRKLVAARGEPCGYCHLPIDYTSLWDLDEILPRSLGGDPFDPDNVRGAHPLCNKRAGGKLGRAIQLRKNRAGNGRDKRAGWDSGRW